MLLCRGKYKNNRINCLKTLSNVKLKILRSLEFVWNQLNFQNLVMLKINLM
jgi:hypothetical protein